VIQYSPNFLVVSLSPRLRNRSNVPIRIHDCAIRHTIAQGSTLSRNANLLGRTVSARALVVGIPIALRYSEIKNSLIEALRTAFPSLPSDSYTGAIRESRIRRLPSSLELQFIAHFSLRIRRLEQRERSPITQLRSPHPKLPPPIILRYKSTKSTDPNPLPQG